MIFLFIFSVFSFLALWFSLKFKKDILTSFIFVFLVNLLLAYFLGLFQVIYLFKYLLILEIVLALVDSFFNLRSQLSIHNLHKMMQPSLIIFILFMAIVLYVNQNRYFYIWDEIVHWGYSAKFLYTQNTFYLNYTGLTGTTYPPATAIISYIFNRFVSTYSEENYYFAALILPLSIYASFLSKFKWKEFLLALCLMLGFVYIPSLLFENFLSSVYVDGLLASVFAYSIVKTLKFDYTDIFHYIELSVILASLVLIKNTGYQFSFIVIFVLIMNYAIKNFKKYKLIDILKLLSIFAFVCLVQKSWIIYTDMHLDFSSSSTVQFSIFSLETLKNILHLSFAQDYQNQVVLNYLSFIQSTNQPKFFISIPYIIWPIVLFTIVGITYYFKNKKNKDVITMISIDLIILGFYGYLSYLMVYYLYYFSSYEATILASADRYLNSYLAMLLIVVLVYVSDFIQSINFRKLLYILVIPIFLLQSYWLFHVTSSLKASSQSTQVERSGYEHLESFNSILSGDDTVVVVAQETSGDFSNYARYLWLPNKIGGYFSFGPLYSSYDQWSVDLSLEEMESYLSEMEYVYLFKVDKQFIERYQFLFDDPTSIKDGNGYKVILYDKTHVSLVLAYE